MCTNSVHRANGRSEAVMKGHICSHCVKYPHFSLPMSCSFTFQPHAESRTHHGTPALLFLIFPSALPDSSWKLEVIGVRGGGAAGFNARYNFTQSHRASSPCIGLKSTQKAAEWKRCFFTITSYTNTILQPFCFCVDSSITDFSQRQDMWTQSRLERVVMCANS